MTEPTPACPFCQRIQRGEYTETPNPDVVTFVPLNPVTPGHRLFLPRGHITRFQHAPALLGQVMVEAAWWAARHSDANLIISSGPHATQTVSHMHVHLVPRHEDDHLTLPWTGQQMGA